MKKIFSRAFISIGLLAILVLIILLINTFTHTSRRFDRKQDKLIEVNINEIAQKLSTLIQIRTVSNQKQAAERSSLAIKKLHQALVTLYPLVHRQLERQVVNNNSLIYRWQGTNVKLKPILLLAHMDVVPVSQSELAQWKFGAFSGYRSKDYIWGRGSLDDKAAIASILYAIETLLKNGYQPKRSIIVAFGHDEEIGGSQGAKQIVKTLQEKNIKPLFILDEWSPVIKTGLLGAKNPVALVGIAEKGTMTVRLSTQADSGHSSRPPKWTAIGRLAKAITLIQQHPMPTRFTYPVRTMLEQVSPQTSFWKRLLISNTWLFKSIVLAKFKEKAATNAMIRTTFAPTLIKGGIKENVLPNTATAVVNIRLLPGDQSTLVLQYLKNLINDTKVEIVPVGEIFEASGVSSVNSLTYIKLAETIVQIYPDSIIAPSIVIGATDSRYFYEFKAPIYRFRPYEIMMLDVKRVHGLNERISIKSLLNAAKFYAQLIKNFSTLN